MFWFILVDIAMMCAHTAQPQIRLVSECASVMVCHQDRSGEDHCVRPFRRRSILTSSEAILVPSLAEGSLHCPLTVYNRFAPPPLEHTYRIFDRGKLSFLVAPGPLEQTCPVFCRRRDIHLVADSPGGYLWRLYVGMGHIALVPEMFCSFWNLWTYTS